MTCDHCGAAIKDAGAFCSHCGTRITRPERTEPAIRAATDPARFDLAKASAGYQSAQHHLPRLSAGTGAGAFVAILVIGFAGFFIISAVSMGAVSDHPAGILFVIVPCVMIFVALKMIVDSAQFARAPIEREVLVVVDERTSTSGGGGNSSVSTSYYATLQARDGARHEYATYGWVAGKIAPGDIGVAFIKRDHLVDFLRLDA